MKLSVIIPTYNEQDFLKNCLRSVSFADEIIVLDSGSTDSTIELATKFTDNIIQYKWKGFKYSHELGASVAKHDWLLYIDADERVSKQLKNQIQSVLDSPSHSAYQMPRKNFILGKPLSHGGWYPDYVTRLINKNTLRSWIGELHEYPEIIGTTGKLDAPIYHLTHRGMEWMLKKTLIYTQKSAQILLENNHPKVTMKNLFGATIREFYFRAFKKSGYKDGIRGWIEIFYQAFNAFLIQAWLWEMQQKKPINQQYQSIDKKISREL